jgi:DNA-damage-inducible protein J
LTDLVKIVMIIIDKMIAYYHLLSAIVIDMCNGVSNMKEASITIRVDPEFKEKCDALFRELGFSTSSAIHSFLKQALREQGMPFTPSLDDKSRTYRGVSIVGRLDPNGRTVLPAEWDDPQDDVYEQLRRIRQMGRMDSRGCLRRRSI